MLIAGLELFEYFTGDQRIFRGAHKCAAGQHRCDTGRRTFSLFLNKTYQLTRAI